jgi:hypothetical protein
MNWLPVATILGRIQDKVRARRSDVRKIADLRDVMTNRRLGAILAAASR